LCPRLWGRPDPYLHAIAQERDAGTDYLVAGLQSFIDLNLIAAKVSNNELS
jgi:hypothetical protein